MLEEIKESGKYVRRIEKAHGRIEKREYYQTEEIGWLPDKEKWTGLKSIGMVRTTLKSEEGETSEIRYYISSLKIEIELFEESVRGHWSIEIMHWHLDVTFGEDKKQTLERV